MVFDFFEGRKKVIVAMIHVGALPGTPLYDADGGMQALIDGARSDFRTDQIFLRPRDARHSRSLWAQVRSRQLGQTWPRHDT